MPVNVQLDTVGAENEASAVAADAGLLARDVGDGDGVDVELDDASSSASGSSGGSSEESSSDESEEEEEEVPVEKRVLPARATRGLRQHALVGEAAEADDTFWGQAAFNEDDSDADYSIDSEGMCCVCAVYAALCVVSVRRPFRHCAHARVHHCPADTSSTVTDSDIDLPEPEDAPIDTTAAGAAGKSMSA